jgi:hypothetical protein
MKLTNTDYIDILNFYKIDHMKMKKREIKEKAEDLLATKLCRCIKKIKQKTPSSSESRAIAICYDSVIKRKGLKTFKFTCKKGAKLLPRKGTEKRKNNIVVTKI